ncbi:molybdopterin-synthase adenylyltransferase MoeB [Oceanicella sp. SM1341]|uniref:HesA/MoeB/ThiF family protein n=1 Tax=Oceanicella sp. SM1341 TaxID=1548889 RepID=UPI000E476683|nr:molybdopterin-synthase adenylyltransferase MoeB [Oceanicella sp. SM1341]
MSFSPEELERYARHIVLREVGGPGQARLKAARVLVLGAGGLGSPALLYLAAAGVGHITLVDDDTVSLSNLQRQVLHDTAHVGARKIDSAAARLAEVNPHVGFTGHALRLTPENAAGLIRGHDLVLDGSDSFATRYAVNAACVAEAVPLVAAAMTQWEGQISLFAPHLGAPCYRCTFPEAPAPGLAPSCAEAGIMGALAGTMGAMMAGEAIKHLTGAGETLLGRLLLWDSLFAEARVLTIRPDPACPECHGHGAAG